MSYTRRAVIRDAAVLSLAGVGGFSPLLSGCHRSRFADGIRIFFEGAWLFCAHPTDPSQMLAVTLNPSECPQPLPKCKQMDPNPNPKNMNHIFPYGIWDERPFWDGRHENTQLADTPCIPTPSGLCLMPIPHRVYVLGRWPQPFQNVDALFVDADSRSRFTYYLNTDQPQARAVNWDTPELKVISLPLPSRIIPAGFRVGADIDDNNTPKMLHAHGQSADTAGVATTHIFDYPGARSMLFVPHGGDAVEMDRGRDFRSDFHFHTVPHSCDLSPCHDVMMFASLVGLLKLTDNLILDPDYGDIKIERGASLPASVGDEEIEMNVRAEKGSGNGKNQDCVQTTNLATCGSGGLGVGGGH
jgi:hypothetical protein